MRGLSAERVVIRLLATAYLTALYFLIADPEWTGVETALGAALCLTVLLRNIRIGQTPIPALLYLAVLFWFSLSLSSYFNYLSDSDPGPIGAQAHKSLSLLFSILIGYCFSLYSRDPRELVFLSHLICFCTIGLCLLIMARYSPGSSELNIEKTVMGFGSSNHNAWAMAVLMVPALICATRHPAPGLRGLVLLAIVLMLTTHATATASRQGVLYAALLALAFAWRSPAGTRLGLTLLAVALPALLIMLSEQAQIATQLIAERYQRVALFLLKGEGASSEGSLPDRLEMSATSLSLWLQAPAYGWGLDGFSRHSGYASYSHNSISETLVSGGLLGSAFYAAILFTTCNRLRRYWPIAAFLLISLAFIVTFQTRPHWIGLFMILIAAASDTKTNSDSTRA